MNKRLSEIYVDLFHPHSQLDPHRRIELCREALAILETGENRLLWGAFQNELGISLMQREVGNRAEAVEEALRAFKKARSATPRQSRPIVWGRTISNLGNAYIAQVSGDRARNIERAIFYYRQALEVLTRETSPLDWVATLMHLGVAFRLRINGKRSENIEQAIRHLDLALTVLTRNEAPRDWAECKMNLAAVYLDRIAEDRAENIEISIRLSHQALSVFTKQDTPIKWALTISNLAGAYSDRVKGDRRVNRERSLGMLQSILPILTRDSFPIEWAKTLLNLGSTYLTRVEGLVADNIEEAIRALQLALEIMSQHSFPYDWAMIQNNLATAYIRRIRGERTENVELAIHHFKNALKVRTRDSAPEEWADVIDNLAAAYLSRTEGNRADNVEEAINACREALSVRTRQDLPSQWAQTQSHLARAFVNRVYGSRAENIEHAIYHFRQALEVVSPHTRPEQWVGTMINLCSAYGQRIRGKKAENIVKAIKLCQEALEVATITEMPVAWAGIQVNLANALLLDTQSKRTRNIEKAIAALTSALEVYTLTGFPMEHLRAQRNLGNLYFEEERWHDAETAYRAAVNANQRLFFTAYTESGRLTEVKESTQLFARLSYSLLKQQKRSEALLALEQGKTRLMTHTLRMAETDTSMLPVQQQRAIERVRQEVRALEREFNLPSDVPGRRTNREIASASQEANAHLNELVEEIRAEHPGFMPVGLDLPELLALIPPDGAFVAPVITSQGSAVFVIPNNSQTINEASVLWLDDFSDEHLNALLVGSETKPGWLRTYFAWRSGDPDTNWHEAMNVLTYQLWESLLGPIHQRLQAFELPITAPILFLPQGGLGLLPLHAAWRRVNERKRYFMDDYVVTYAPSGYSLEVGRHRLQDDARHQRSLFAAVNPTRDLPFTPTEAEAAMSFFEPENSLNLFEQDATPDAILARAPGYSHLLFACHGFYNWRDVMRSGLVFADDENLTLADIIGHLDLSATRLVILSACETGMTEFQQLPDEFVGLPTGFLQAGAPCVVSTLWSVNDASTAMLLSRFCAYYLRDGLEPVEALRQAQIWLRDSTDGEKRAFFRASEEGETWLSPAAAKAFYQALAFTEDHVHSFEHLYYWAAFTYTGYRLNKNSVDTLNE